MLAMKNILNRGFSGLSLDAFIAKVKIILAALTGNLAFPITDPTLANVQTQLDALENAAVLRDPAAQNAGVSKERPKLEMMLDDLADNLEKTAAGDTAKLATTGFDLHATANTPTTVSPQPQNVRCKANGTSHEFQVLMDGTAGAKVIEVETTLDPVNGPWAPAGIFSSSRGIILKDQPRAKDVWVRARTRAANNTVSGWSDPATILVP